MSGSVRCLRVRKVKRRLLLFEVQVLCLSTHKMCMQFPKVIGSSCLFAMTFKISSVVSWLIRLQLQTLSMISSRGQLLPVWRKLALSSMIPSDGW